MKIRSICKKTAKYMLFALLGLVICLNCLTFVFSELGLRSRLSWIPGALFRVETGSMEPELYAGDLIFIWRTPFADLQVGDTVTTVTDGTYSTHRIVRIADDEIVTRGLVNEIDDRPVGGTAYVGKKIFSLRGMGDAYETLTSPAVCIALVLCIVLLFLAKPLYRWLSGKTARLKVSAARALCGLLCVSMAILPPMSTLAKFSGVVSAGKTVAAAEINFTSNYLTAEGNAYDIIGWNGEPYRMDISVNNFGNALKYNPDDVDFTYSIEVEKIDSDDTRSYSLEYTVEVQDGHPIGHIQNSSGTSETDPLIFPTKDPEPIFAENGVETGHRLGDFVISGGEKTTHTFQYVVNAFTDPMNHTMNLTDGSKIKFRITAKTSATEGYSQRISADFTMTVTTAQYFITQSILDQNPGNTVVRYTCKSATLINVPEKRVVIQWDPTLLYLNEYDTTFWNMNHNGQCVHSREDGTLSFMMAATSSIKFEFFRFSDQLNTELAQEREQVDPNGIPNSGDEYELVRIYRAGGEKPPIPDLH